jgi:hypothetical protein
MRLSRLVVTAFIIFVLAGLLASAGAQTTARPTNSASHIQSLFGLFTDNPFTGGQVAPRQYRWVNNDVLMFVLFDRPRAAEARALRYIGMSIKGTFCAEAQPRGANGGFTHYHRVNSPTYGAGHGGPPGFNEGYWLFWVAVDEFDTPSGKVVPGVDYAFSPTPPPTCGSNVPRATFQGPGQHRLTRAEIRRLAAFFNDNPLRGRQTAPRHYRWVNGDVLIWLQFDKPNPAKATALRHLGIAKRGTFCREDQGHADFTYFQRLKAKSYDKGRRGAKRGEAGFWHLAVSLDPKKPGVDRSFLRTRAPSCPKA